MIETGKRERAERAWLAADGRHAEATARRHQPGGRRAQCPADGWLAQNAAASDANRDAMDDQSSSDEDQDAKRARHANAATVRMLIAEHVAPDNALQSLQVQRPCGLA